MEIINLKPRLNPGRYVWCCLPKNIPAPVDCVCQMLEEEGLTVVLSQDSAARLGYPISFQAEWITLDVHSDLAAIGLTAKVSTALANAGIACNIVAGYHHDHLFVPAGQGQKAVLVLQELQKPVR